MDVTAVIPAYNSAGTIDATLASLVAASTHVRLTAVVVDDGSTDSTAEVAEAHLVRSRLPHRVLRTDHRGVSAARNVGWQAANTDWILFLDADDLVAPTLFASLRSSLASDSGADIVFAPWQRCVAMGSQVQLVGNVVTPHLPDRVPVALLRDENFIKTGSYIIRRAILAKVAGFDEAMRQIEDVTILVRAAMAGAVFRRSAAVKPQLFYRQRTSGVVHADEFIEGCLTNAMLVEEWLRREGDLHASERHVLTRVYFQGSRHYAGRNWKRFEQIVAQIRRLNGRVSPQGPPGLRWLSRIVGYATAERIAVSVRQFKSKWHVTP